MLKWAPTVIALCFALLGTTYCGASNAPDSGNGEPDAAESGIASSSGATGSSGAASSGSSGSPGGASSSSSGASGSGASSGSAGSSGGTSSSGGGSSSSSGSGSSTGSSGSGSSSGSGVDPTTCAQATRIVAQYKGQWKAPPTQVDTTGQTDAPLLGNGDVGVAVLGTIASMTFALGKNEFWTLASGRGQVTPMARETLRIPDMSGASYAVMRRSFQDAMREAQVANVVVRSISGHLTEQMQQRYSTARGYEQQAAIARIIDLTRVQQRVRGGRGSEVDSKVDSTGGQHKATG